MIYKSYCSIDIQYYPFDIQNCTLKFGLWTYYGSLANLQFLTDNQSSIIERGWDLEDYTPSIEWDILSKLMKFVCNIKKNKMMIFLRSSSYST